MSAKNKSLAMELAENMADLAETAFGWDSLEAAESRKEAGLRGMKAERWKEAHAHLKSSLEAFETIFGAEDPHCLQLQRVLKDCESYLPRDDAAVVAAYRDISRLGLLKSIKAVRRKNNKRNLFNTP